MKLPILSLLALCTSSLCSAAYQESGAPQPNTGHIQIVPMPRSAEPNQVVTKILYPKQGEIEKTSPVRGQTRISNFALGTDTMQPRRKEIWNDPKGQALHVVIDNQPYFSIDENLTNALDDSSIYFDYDSEFTIPYKLSPGMHLIRAFPVTSYNESIKSLGAFAVTTFYYQEKKDNPAIDLSKPYLTYNEPQGEYDFDPKKNEPILLDFYLTNCELSRDGYKVRITIDSETSRVLTDWKPYFIYGLTKGSHHIQLELLDLDNKRVPGLLNSVTRTIVLK